MPHDATVPAADLAHPWLRLFSPKTFDRACRRLIPWSAGLAVLFGVAGLVVGLGVAPTDHQQGDAYRIIFVHVPAAWMSMLIYLAMAAWYAGGLAWNTRIAFAMGHALAPTGAMFTALALASGALWGRPTWGTWWVWDARLTSELILLFLYAGVIALRASTDDPRRADRASALMALVGVVNIPIIYFSVQWWNTLHQGASVSLNNGSSMAGIMLAGMLLMVLSCWAYTVAVALVRARCILEERALLAMRWSRH